MRNIYANKSWVADGMAYRGVATAKHFLRM